MVLPPRKETSVFKRKLNLNNSRPNDVFKWSNHKEVKKAVKDIADTVIKSDVRQRQRDMKGLRATIAVLSLDLYVAWSTDPELVVSIHKTPKRYAKGISRYSKIRLKYANTMLAIKLLKQFGLLEEHPGFFNHETKSGRLTRLIATNKLIGLIKQHRVLVPMVSLNPHRELVILTRTEEVRSKKTGKKRKIKIPVDYEDTESTNRMRHNLRIINQAYYETNIDVKLTDEQHTLLNIAVRKDPEKSGLDVTRKQVRRKFLNCDFGQGGRLTGPFWQYLPRDYRKLITIDGKPTLEWDYSSLHARMLYAFENHPVGSKEDLYTLAGFTGKKGRDFVKDACNIMINAKSDDAAKRAIAKDVITTDQLPKAYYKTLEDFMGAIKHRHEPIRHHFNSGAGTFLQYLDSVIAEQVILRMLQHGEVVLPVHDSFIVKKTHQHLLSRVMKYCFAQLFKSPIDMKAKAIELPPEPEGEYEIDFNATEKTILKIKHESDTGSSPYYWYEVRQAQWHKAYPIRYAPNSEEIILENIITSRFLKHCT